MRSDSRLQFRPKEEILSEHLGYSLDLVAMAVKEIEEEGFDKKSPREWFRQMACIEVFWSQLRLLIEFFEGSPASTNTASAAHFTISKISYDFALGGKDIKRMLNDQVAHMNYGRTGVEGEKLQLVDMQRIANALHRNVRLFEKNLKEEFKTVWEARISGRLLLEPNTVLSVENVSSACTVFQTSEQTSSSWGAQGTGPQIVITDSGQGG